MSIWVGLLSSIQVGGYFLVHSFILLLWQTCGMSLHEWAGLCAVTGARKAGVLPTPGLWEEESLSQEVT